ncbi:MAG TPA: hypothetical protein VKV36_09520 [Acidimicrobiales bacterium]|nr:hypothetical protein [Acidimicrobiales bacterium]
MARRKSLRSQLYRAARDLGNVEAAEKGFERGGLSGALAGETKRYARRAVYRKTNSFTAALLRSLGLQGGGRRRR